MRKIDERPRGSCLEVVEAGGRKKARRRESGAPVIEGSIFGPWGPVTIWDSGDTGEIIDYHGTDLSPPSFFLSLSFSGLFSSFFHLFFSFFICPHQAPTPLSDRRQNLYLAAATEMHPRLNGGRAFNGAANCETKNIWFPKEQP